MKTPTLKKLKQQNNEGVKAQHQETKTNTQANTAQNKTTYTRATEKIGRNEPCPCGSGKKYKQCHGKKS